MAQQPKSKEFEVTTASLDELKAMAYDQMVILQQVQTNLSLIQAEIKKREEASA